MKKEDWFCKECSANFVWAVWSSFGDPIKEAKLRQPKTKEDWKEAELFTDLGMNPGEFYAVGENGIELNQEVCKACKGKINGGMKK